MSNLYMYLQGKQLVVGAVTEWVWGFSLLTPSDCFRTRVRVSVTSQTHTGILASLSLFGTLVHPSKSVACTYKCGAFRVTSSPLGTWRYMYSLMTSPCAPPGEKWSGEQSQISWAYSPKTVKDQWDCEIANYYVALPFTTLIISTGVSVLFLSGFSAKYLERC